MGRYLQVSVFARGWPPNSTATENIQEPRSLIMWNIHTFPSPTHFSPYDDTFLRQSLQAVSVSSLSLTEVTHCGPEEIFPLTVWLGWEMDVNCELSWWLIIQGLQTPPTALREPERDLAS